MIINNFIYIDNKLVNYKMIIQINNNKLIVNLLSKYNELIKIPFYNKFNGLFYEPINFPLEMIIINNKVFSPYLILSSYNLKNIEDLDFFNKLEIFISEKYNLNFFDFNYFINDNKNNLFNIINDNYLNELNQLFIIKNQDFNKFIKSFWNNLNIVKILLIYILIKFPYISTKNVNDIIKKYKIPNYILDLVIFIKNKSYDLMSNNQNKTIDSVITNIISNNNLNFIDFLDLQLNSNDNIIKNLDFIENNNINNQIIDTTELMNDMHSMTFNNYYNHNNQNPLSLKNLKKHTHYFILIEYDNTSIFNLNEDITMKKCNTNNNQMLLDKYNSKIIKIFVNNINNNIITINNNKNIIYENYKWFYYYPSIIFNNDYVIFNTFINFNFTKIILKYILNLTQKNKIKKDSIINLQANKIIEYYNYNYKYSNISIIYNNFIESTEQIDDFSILKKNSFTDEFFQYITHKYSFDIENIYNILEILFNNYNYPLKSNRHEMDNTFDYIIYFSLINYNHIFNNELEKYNISLIIPYKLRNLYNNIIKSLNQIINNSFDSITYNQKIYNDYLHRHIIKLFLFNSNKLSVNIFQSLANLKLFTKFKSIIITNIILIDISTKINWSNLSRKLNYLDFFYKNNNLIFYQNKINKNIIHDNIDNRIKKIIENPFDMYKYLRKEKDFIKWTNFISHKIIQLYYTPITISSDDFNKIGKLIYLLFNIQEQNINDESYIMFINFCNKYNKLILDLNRINIKIKEKFSNLKFNINLGILAKHLTWNKESFKFDNNILKEKSKEFLNLKMKLNIATKKYYKYKTKYLQTKSHITDNNMSETSITIPIN
uniref:Uncharacterized protein n=1 Tax=viral metagenome TaxID=1070528 RepID=A0A6C0ECF4_9ZZZZ